MSGPNRENTPDIITSNTSIPQIIDRLAESGCPDLTSDLDLARCSQWSVNGGGQGDIYEGRLTNGEQVAIKTIRGDQSLDLSKGNILFKRMARELYTWYRLSHQNIARLLGMATFRGHIAMISPWISPGDFYKFIDKYPEADRMDLCIQVASGLAYLHENQIVFGDLKAQNVLIGPDGTAKITDFGLSVLGEATCMFSTTQSSGGGSLRWMAPELISDPTSKRSYEADVYALAMTFIEILTNEFPFPKLDDVKIIYAIVINKSTPEQPQRLTVKSLRHESWWLLLQKCWDQEPGRRPKASDWVTLDARQARYRVKELTRQLSMALAHGYTAKGSLKDIDTDEELNPGNKTSVFLPADRDLMSIEQDLQALVDFCGPQAGNRQHIPDSEYAEALQELIYKALDERVDLVRHWVTVNVRHFPSEIALFNCALPAARAVCYVASDQTSMQVLNIAADQTIDVFFGVRPPDIRNGNPAIYRGAGHQGEHTYDGYQPGPGYDDMGDHHHYREHTPHDLDPDTDEPQRTPSGTGALQAHVAPPVWQRVHQRLLDLAMAWPLSELDEALASTEHGHQVKEIALTVWCTQVYKRYVRTRMPEGWVNANGDPGAQKVDRMYVPPNMADSISTAVYDGRHGDACQMLKDMWTSFGLEGMPKLIIVLARHRRDENHWVTHRFSLPDGLLSTYDTYPERSLPDGRPLGWWFAIRAAWPYASYPPVDGLAQKVTRIKRPTQLLVDCSVAAAAIWRNLLLGSKAERSVGLARLRGLINTEVKSLKQRKELGRLTVSNSKRDE